MRILHTSDWHLGAELETRSREDEHRLFLEWLTQTLVDEAIDVLIVAGDVFHHANPSAAAMRMYYDFLHALSDLPSLRATVIIGGNHDSASRLDSPRALLDHRNITVVGGYSPQERERAFVPVVGASGAVELVVIAVPYIHEYRLGISSIHRSADEVRASTIAAFQGVYDGLAADAQQRWPGARIVGTGHMTCAGSTDDDYGTPLHNVGSIDALPGDIFGPRYDYVALGHIHRNYPVAGGKAWYSGAPLSLRFNPSELSPRLVNIVDVDAPTPVLRRNIPMGRRLIQVSGTLAEVERAVRATTADTPLGTWIDAVVHSEDPLPNVLPRLRELCQPHVDVLTAPVRNPLVNRAAAMAEMTHVDVRELSPRDVFEKLYTVVNPGTSVVPESLMMAFQDAMASVIEGDNR